MRGTTIMQVISEIFKEEGEFRAKAQVVLEVDQYKLVIYDANGNFITEEYFPGKSLHYVEDAAENWATGLKVLNG